MLRKIKARFLKTRTLPQLQLVGDQLMVLYCYTFSENPMISCPIVEVLVKGSEVLRPLSMKGAETHDLGAREKTARTLRSPQRKKEVA